MLRFQTRKTGALLAYLAYYLQRSHPREELAEKIWPDADGDNSLHSLRQALSSLRRQLEPPGVPAGSVIVATHSSVQLNPEAVNTDVAAFAAAIQAARRAGDDTERIKNFVRAAALYTGELLPGLLDDWAVVERDRLANALVRSLEQIVAHYEQSGSGERALEYALRLLAAAPDRQDAHHSVIRLYLNLGRRADAERHYRRMLRSSQRSGLAAPVPETRALLRRTQTPASTSEQRTAVTRSQPDQPLAAEEAGSDEPRLPVKLSRFFGRDEEMERLARLLDPDRVESDERDSGAPARLVTLVGAGGAGKTRLAVECAHAIAPHYAGAVYFAALAELRDPTLIPTAILAAIGAAERGGDPWALLARALQGRPSLVVLDNCEQLMPAASDAIVRLLNVAPSAACLVTSRQPSGVDGEVLLPVAPLPVPIVSTSAERLLEFAAVRMFVDRARRVSPDFQVTARNAAAVAAVCRKLEGIPLAIELAAARAQSMSPAQMLEELSDRYGFLVSRRRGGEEHHQTLREAVAWSYELLDPDLRRLFARLSVFRGGFTLEAARLIAVDPAALDHLEQLLQRSLLVAALRDDRMRYTMLETLREFAEELLTAAERAECEQRHVHYFLDFAERAEPRLRSPHQDAELARVDAEHDNLRAALDRIVDPGERLRFCGALWRYWLLRAHVREGIERLEPAVAKAESAPERIRARGMAGLASLKFLSGELTEADQIARHAVQVGRSSDSAPELAQALGIRALVAEAQGEYIEARRSFEEAMALRRAMGDEWGLAGVLNNLGRLARSQSDSDRAASLFHESWALYERIGDEMNAAVVMSNLGSVEFDRGEYAAARMAYEDSLSFCRRSGNRSWHATILHNLGETLVRMGNGRAAGPVLAESLSIRYELGERASASYTLAGLANVACGAGDPVRAAALFGGADAIRTACGAPHVREDLWLQDVQAVRRLLPKDEFDAAWRYGSFLPYDRVVRLALEPFGPDARSQFAA